MNIRPVILSILTILLVLVTPTTALAATYGSGTYGGGNYNAGIISVISNAVSSAAGSVASAISSWTCTSQAPSSAPNLYEIDTTGSTAKLYFAPAGSPYTNYYVSFGQGSKDEGNGGEFALSQTTGALKYDVYFLKPNTSYTFKVRAGNGCKAGAWSGTLTAKTGAKNSKVLARYFPTKQAVVAKSAPLSGVKKWITSVFQKPQSQTGTGTKSQSANSNTPSNIQQTQKANTPQAPKQQPAQQPQKQQSAWGNITSFFGNLFH